jgi:hypothetical protein
MLPHDVAMVTRADRLPVTPVCLLDPLQQRRLTGDPLRRALPVRCRRASILIDHGRELSLHSSLHNVTMVPLRNENMLLICGDARAGDIDRP